MVEKAEAGDNPAEGIWPHPRDYTLRGTDRAGDKEKMIESRNFPSLAKAIRMYFDGVHRKEHGGVGGFVAFDPIG